MQMQQGHVVQHLEQDMPPNQSIWIMSTVVGQREVSLSASAQLGMTVFIGRMLVSYVEVKDGEYVCDSNLLF